MIQKEFLELLRCPINHCSLANADARLIARLNSRIAAGQIRNRLGEVVIEQVESGLVGQSMTVIYPVRNGIPCLLADEAISLDQLEGD
jgi:uncharacterized protein YbaR (Trm112 family)